jgi:hypothetical protein
MTLNICLDILPQFQPHLQMARLNRPSTNLRRNICSPRSFFHDSVSLNFLFKPPQEDLFLPPKFFMRFCITSSTCLMLLSQEKCSTFYDLIKKSVNAALSLFHFREKRETFLLITKNLLIALGYNSLPLRLLQRNTSKFSQNLFH